MYNKLLLKNSAPEQKQFQPVTLSTTILCLISLWPALVSSPLIHLVRSLTRYQEGLLNFTRVLQYTMVPVELEIAGGGLWVINQNGAHGPVETH